MHLDQVTMFFNCILLIFYNKHLENGDIFSSWSGQDVKKFLVFRALKLSYSPNCNLLIKIMNSFILSPPLSKTESTVVLWFLYTYFRWWTSSWEQLKYSHHHQITWHRMTVAKYTENQNFIPWKQAYIQNLCWDLCHRFYHGLFSSSGNCTSVGLY